MRDYSTVISSERATGDGSEDANRTYNGCHRISRGDGEAAQFRCTVANIHVQTSQTSPELQG